VKGKQCDTLRMVSNTPVDINSCKLDSCHYNTDLLTSGFDPKECLIGVPTLSFFSFHGFNFQLINSKNLRAGASRKGNPIQLLIEKS
jgi:hypothetical protein